MAVRTVCPHVPDVNLTTKDPGRTIAFPFITISADVQKILVTGATGFVGSALCAEMKRRTIPFVPAVRASTRPDQFQTGDLSGPVDWAAAVSGCSAVVHLAGRVHRMQEQLADPLATYRAMNVTATLELARAAALDGVRRFLFVSTVKVNGEATHAQPFSSSDVPQPADPYAQSKWEAEQGLREIGAQSAMEIVIVRPPLVYGPGVRANFLRLMQLVQAGVPLPLGAVVNNRRSLVGIDNLVDFLLLCVTAPDAAGKTFLISDQHDLSTADLIRLIAAAMGKPARLLPVPPSWLSGIASALGKGRAADRLLGSLQVDATLASRLLGWTPVISVEEGIRRTVNKFLMQSRP
jgi:nucleoside-diphosphate-sugar epimerase